MAWILFTPEICVGADNCLVFALLLALFAILSILAIRAMQALFGKLAILVILTKLGKLAILDIKVLIGLLAKQAIIGIQAEPTLLILFPVI